jgi:TonB family protein
MVAEELRLIRILEDARLATGATGAAIALTRGPQLVCCATSGSNAPAFGSRLDPLSGLSGYCVQTGQIQQCSNAETDHRVNLEACQILGIRSIVVLPLVDAGRLCGVFEVLSSSPEAFSADHLQALRKLADRVLDSSLPPESTDARGKDLSVDAKLAELDALLKSAKPDTGRNRRRKLTKIRIGALIAVAVLAGWGLGDNVRTKAIAAAEREIFGVQNDPQAVAPIAPSVAENVGGTLQPEGPQESNPAVSNYPASNYPATPAEPTSSFILTRVDPEYPQEARQKQIHGRVVMRIVVGTDGVVRDVVVESGNPILATSAVSAVRKWRFRTHNVNGEPVEFETKITVNFSYRGNRPDRYTSSL